MERKEALALGTKTYMPNKPCKNGHTSERYTRSGACLACLRVGDPAPVDPSGTMPPLRLHPDDITQLLQMASYLNEARGKGALPVDAIQAHAHVSTPTEWEKFLEAGKRQRERDGAGPSLIEMLATAHAMGIPETYRPGNKRPVDVWTENAVFLETVARKKAQLLAEEAARFAELQATTPPLPATPVAVAYTATQLEAMKYEDRALAMRAMVNAGLAVPQLAMDDDGSAPRNPYA